MEDCIFCKIVKGEIPSFKIAENEKALAFLSIDQFAKGHTLVIPKNHAESIFELPVEEMQNFLELVKKIAEKMKKNLNSGGVNILNASGKAAQQSVFHLHFHVIPRKNDDGLNAWPFKEKLANIDLKEVCEQLKK